MSKNKEDIKTTGTITPEQAKRNMWCYPLGTFGRDMIYSLFTNFTQIQYDNLFGQLGDGTIVVDNSSDVSVTPEVSAITVDYQE